MTLKFRIILISSRQIRFYCVSLPWKIYCYCYKVFTTFLFPTALTSQLVLNDLLMIDKKKKQVSKTTFYTTVDPYSKQSTANTVYTRKLLFLCFGDYKRYGLICLTAFRNV